MKHYLSLSLVAMLLLGLSVNVLADHRDYYRYSENEVREIGARNGYEIGYRAGMKDARQGYKLDYKHDPDYKFGLVGYRGEYRHDGNYKKGFRQAFEAGYREGYGKEYRRGGSGWGWGNRDRNRNDDDRRDRPNRY